MRDARFIRDPVFLFGLGLYFVNQLLLKPHLSAGFLHNHWNDFLVVACAMPPVLWLHTKVGIRSDDRHPGLLEVAGHLAVWSVLIEWVGPKWMSWTTGDPLDVIAYWVGGAMALACWHRHRIRRWVGQRMQAFAFG